MSEKFIEGLILAAGICTGTVVFEWTRRAVRTLTRKFFGALGRLAARPKFVKGGR